MQQTPTTPGLALAVLAAVAACPVLCAQRDAELEAPIRLATTDGQPIDSGPHNGHSGPRLSDLDGDDLPDLLVGTYRGRVQLYRNVGTRTEPRFDAAGLLEVDGNAVEIRNW